MFPVARIKSMRQRLGEVGLKLFASYGLSHKPLGSRP